MLPKTITYTLLILFVTSLSLAAQNQWELLNPKPSGATGVKIYFTSPDTGFIINNREILMTSDCGEKWIINKYITSSNDINFLNSSGFIVGNNGYVLKTLNKGLDWAPINLGVTDNLNTVNLISKDTIFITGSNKLFKSYDGGISWHSVAIPTYTVNKSVFINSKTGHVACNSGKIMKTIDSGQTWYVTESVIYSPSNFFTIYFINKNTGFASREHSDILKTNDGGEHWIKMPNTTDAIYSFNFLDEQNGFIAGNYGVIFKTSNGGTSWAWAGFQSGRYDASTIYSLKFINNNTGFAVGMRGVILKTTDGGQSWKGYAPLYTGITQLDLISDKTGYALAGNEFFKTTDGGNNWQSIGAPVQKIKTPRFDFADENIGYCLLGGEVGTSGTSSLVYKTTDGGKNWVSTNNNKPVHWDNLYSIDFVNENTGYVSGGYNNTNTYKTIDGGNTWELINSLSFNQIQFFNPQVGYGRTYNRIYRTTDGGKVWIISYNAAEEITSFHFTDENNGYLVGDMAMLYNTHDGGVTWNKLSIPYGYYDFIKFYSTNVGYVLDEYGKLFKTTNGGASWESLYTGYSLRSIGFFGDNIYLSGPNGLILKGKVDYPPVSLLVNPVTVVTNSSATFTGNVASNEGKIDNIRFEYGISLFNNISPGVPDVANSGTSVNTTATVKDLIPSTSYSFKLKATYNGQDYISNILQFKTLPDFELTMNYVYNPMSNEANLSGKVTSNKGSVTSIEFQYGTDTTFASKISSTPVSVAEGTTSVISGYIFSLKPGTTYYARIKAIHDGKIRYSSIVTFTTLKEFVINLFTPSISGNNVSFQAAITANKDTIRNIVLEYGTSRDYRRKVTTSPNQVNKYGYGYITALVNNLNTDSVYYYRIKASLGSVTIYSEENILSLKGGIIIIPLKEEQKSNSSVLLQGLINTNGKYLGNIRFQYGLTGSFTDSINANINSIYNYGTSKVSSTISNLVPDTQYHFRISASDGTKRYYSDEIVFTLGLNTGVESNNSFKDVSVYPNPASSYIYIRSPYIIKRCELIDLYGRKLLIQKDEKFIDISAYPKGVYTLKIFVNNKIITRRVIKN